MLRGAWKLFNHTAMARDLGLWVSTVCCLYCTTLGYKQLASACLGAGITELHGPLHLCIKIYRDVLGQDLHLYELQSVEWTLVFPGATRCSFKANSQVCTRYYSTNNHNHTPRLPMYKYILLDRFYLHLVYDTAVCTIMCPHWRWEGQSWVRHSTIYIQGMHFQIVS